MSNYVDVAHDLWIIADWMMKEDFNGLREELIEERIGALFAGHELDDEYTAEGRIHVFSDDTCEVWLGCMDSLWVSPEKLCSMINLLIEDADMAFSISCDSVFAVMLDGRNVTGWWRREVSHGSPKQ